MQHAMEHFLHNRLDESELVNTNPLPEVIPMLENDRTTSRKYVSLLDTGNFIDRLLDVLG